MKKFTTLLLLLIFTIPLWSQESTNDSTLKILVQDQKTLEPLPYANILFLRQQRGTISNESGWFAITPEDFILDDTISIQYIGYKTQKISMLELANIKTVDLEEDLINLSEAWVYGNPPKAKDIIKKVIENREKNYTSVTAKRQIFIRSRQNTDFKEFSSDIKRNSISEIDQQLIDRILRKIPRHITSFTDFLGHAYSHQNAVDSLKISPQKIVSLKDIEFDELDQFGKIFEAMFKDTNKEEYWKVKTGIFGEKIDMEEETSSDSTEQNNEESKHENQMHKGGIKWNLLNQVKYASLKDEKQWEFLYKTGSYRYELVGGTKVNGEDVFIIDFRPSGGGKFVGRAYVSTSTYALIKADYKYADGKDGRDIQLLGIGYHENKYKTSIYYEKIGESYQLKYLSHSQALGIGFNRKVALEKKKKRWLFDKTLLELKVRLNIEMETEEITELLFLNKETIPSADFVKFEEPEWMDVIYVDHFNDDLWKGYPIIEPTKKMREYQKQEVNWSELGK